METLRSLREGRGRRGVERREREKIDKEEVSEPQHADREARSYARCPGREKQRGDTAP